MGTSTPTTISTGACAPQRVKATRSRSASKLRSVEAAMPAERACVSAAKTTSMRLDRREVGRELPSLRKSRKTATLDSTGTRCAGLNHIQG